MSNISTVFCMFLIFLSFQAGGITDTKVPSHFKTNFKQIKYLKHTNIKLISEGEIELNKKKEIIKWSQIKPFNNIITIDLKRFEKNNIIKLEEKIYMTIGKIFFEIMNQSYENLNQHFSLNKINKHKIKLIPKTKRIAQFLKEITITSKEFVENFHMAEVNGNFMDITFENFKEL